LLDSLSRGKTWASDVTFGASEQAEGREMVKTAFRVRLTVLLLVLSLGVAKSGSAQAPDGPQKDAPAPATQPSSPAAQSQSTGTKVVVPSGTRIGVILENGISTATAKPGDSVYFRTSFPITVNNKVVMPVGSYLRGEITEAKRPGRVKGKGELRMKLNTLILPNGYTVDLNAEPHSTDSGSKTTTDSEGKITGPSGKGKDAETIATTTGAGAGIGAIAGGGKGAGIGAGIGGAAGLAAVLLSRGPEAQLPRGSSMDLVLEHDLQLDADQIHYTHVGQPNTVVVQQPAP
jgi:type IV secretion system protein VirB10